MLTVLLIFHFKDVASGSNPGVGIKKRSLTRDCQIMNMIRSIFELYNNNNDNMIINSI